MPDDYKRPDPDELLARLKAEEQQQARGRLKIFLGYVAGVGKTYAMLEAAHQRLKEGVDVVVGYIETHGRKETDALVAGLPVIPRKAVDYHGTTLEEMDLDAVLLRRPGLVLVDELAHTNAPGSRHPKRFLDVEEILSAGIDVYTTINIQHLESLNDVVQQITGVVVHETIPDRLLDQAAEIELVDLPTDELLQRLKDGKIYVSEAAARALEQFFRKGNLTALRELSMRRAAERVDSQMVDYMQTKAISGPWPAGEHILVCISSHPMGERLIRAGKRLAADLNADWTVLYVETPGHLHMPAASRERLDRNLRLAEDLGAKVVSMTAESVARVVISYAHEHNITKIIAGKPLRPRWYEMIRGTVIDQILRQSGKIDVYVISEDIPVPQRVFVSDLTLRSPLSRYLMSLGLVGMAILVGFPLHNFLDPTNLAMIFLLAVVISAFFLGRGPAILNSIVGVLAFDFFFVDPRFKFTVNDTQYFITFAVLLAVGLIISNSAALLRDQVAVLRLREQNEQALNTFGSELTSAITLEEVLDTVLRNVSAMLGRETVILLPMGSTFPSVESFSSGQPIPEKSSAVGRVAVLDGPRTGGRFQFALSGGNRRRDAAQVLKRGQVFNGSTGPEMQSSNSGQAPEGSTGTVRSADAVRRQELAADKDAAGRQDLIKSPRLEVRAASPDITLSETELAVAEWAYKNRRPAGRGTDTLPSAQFRYTPLVSSRGTVGVLGVRPLDAASRLSMEQRRLIEGVVNLSALAIERASLANQAAQSEMFHRTEKLQTALLNSISHELRTPLATITGVLTSLSDSIRDDDGRRLDPDTTEELIESATRQANRLNRLVENLLDMTRLEAGALRLHPQPTDLQDLINTLINQSHDNFSNHSFKVDLPPDLPLIPMDTVLIGQVLENLLDNACKYSPPGSQVRIEAVLENGSVKISVRDEGIGIPEGDLERVFDKFYRVMHSENPVTGTGLGLSICKGIVEAHGGKISAENNPDRGATVTFSLPLKS